MTAYELPRADIAGSDQAQVSQATSGPENSASGSPGQLPQGDSAVARQPQDGAGNGAGSRPAGDDIDREWPYRLAAANRYLLTEINIMAKQLAIARRGMALLETVSSDWNEAADLVKKWKEAIA